MPDFAAAHPGSVLASDYGYACQSFVLLHQRMLAWYQLDQRSLQAELQLKHSLIKFMVTTNSLTHVDKSHSLKSIWHLKYKILPNNPDFSTARLDG